MSDSPLHDRLRMIAQGRSFRHLGELTSTNPETVRRYMHGQSPSAEFLVSLCTALGINAQWLLTGQGPVNQSEVKGHVLEAANGTDLLTAMAETIEKLIERVERLERFVQELDVRVAASRETPPRIGAVVTHDHGQGNIQILEGKPNQGGANASYISDAIPRPGRETA